MYIKLVLVYRYRVGNHYEFSKMGEELVDDNDFIKKNKILDTFKRIARCHADMYYFPDWYYIIHDLPLGNLLISSGGRCHNYWKVNAKELLPNKWRQIIVNGRKRWLMLNSEQTRIF